MKTRDLPLTMILLEALKNVKILRKQLQVGSAAVLSVMVTNSKAAVIVDTQYAYKLLDEVETRHRKQLEELNVELEEDQ